MSAVRSQQSPQYLDREVIGHGEARGRFETLLTGRHNVGNVLTLQRPFPFTPQSGDFVTVLAGCNRTLAKCKTFTNASNPSGTNVENFGAFPHVPGNSKLLRYPE